MIKLCFDNPEMYYISLICDCAFEFFNLIFLFLSSVSAAEKEKNQLKGDWVLGIEEVALFCFKDVNQQLRHLSSQHA